MNTKPNRFSIRRSLFSLFSSPFSSFTQLQPPARWYLLHASLLTAGLGISSLFYNLAIDSLGYERSFLGSLGSISTVAAFGLCVPIWLLVNRIGLRTALLASAALQAASALTLAVWPDSGPLLLASAATGPAAVLFQVSAAPFMMAHSSSAERDYLFSLNAALNIGVAGLSKLVGGSLPLLLGTVLRVPDTSALVFRAAFVVVSGILLLSLVPLLAMDDRTKNKEQRTESRELRTEADQALSVVSEQARSFRGIFWTLWPIIPLLVPPLLISCGAALLIPYLNLFLTARFQLSSVSLGAIFAAGDILTGLVVLAAPPLARRLGKIPAIALTQLVSIPFLLLSGFTASAGIAAGALLLRGALFNLGVPLYDAFAMERSDPPLRPAVIGLINAAYGFGYLVGPIVSTRVQTSYGFGPLFVATACFYLLAVAALWWLFRATKSKDDNTFIKSP